MIYLNGSDIAGYMKENQAHIVRSLRAQKIFPRLAIIRDSDDPVIAKYVELKKQYGHDIGVGVDDLFSDNIIDIIHQTNNNTSTHGMIVQLPLRNSENLESILNEIAPEKDVDGLRGVYDEETKFESATATAINWLLAGYDINLKDERIALVGYGKLIGKPLERMWKNSGYDTRVFRSKDDLSELKNYSLIVSATGVPRLIKNSMVRPGAILVDAGTASEGGVLVGDIDDEVRGRSDLKAITPKVGGVGPLTIAALFEHVLIASQQKQVPSYHALT